MKKGFRFEILKESRKSRARVGRLFTPHGVMDTPGLVFVGTQGTLKYVPTHEAEALGMQGMFCNTFHLLLQPGLPELVEKAGGLHAFTGYRAGPILTDSGGFQAFSLAPTSSRGLSVHESVTPRDEVASTFGGTRSHPTPRNSPAGDGLLRKVTEDGLEFRSYRDGRLLRLSPELSVRTQKMLGADIILPLDELLAGSVTDEFRIRRSLDRTHRWMDRSLKTHVEDPRDQAMYGIIHGGLSAELRRESLALLLAPKPHGGSFEGLAVGGSVGRNAEDVAAVLDALAPAWPRELPRHLLGIGDMPTVLEGALRGIDTFDSAYPTRIGRHGTILTANGKMNLMRADHRSEHDVPLEIGCECPTCRTYSRAYLHHLHKANEPAGLLLTTSHNVFFMARWMAQLRERILSDQL